MTASGAPLEVLGFAVAVIMAVGSAFAATNTMYAAVARRSKEIGTLRALGFSRAAILFSVITESVCLALIGGILGCCWRSHQRPGHGHRQLLHVHRCDVPIPRQSHGDVLGPGLCCYDWALGGFLPAYGASKKDIVQAMRDA